MRCSECQKTILNDSDYCAYCGCEVDKCFKVSTTHNEIKILLPIILIVLLISITGGFFFVNMLKGGDRLSYEPYLGTWIDYSGANIYGSNYLDAVITGSKLVIKVTHSTPDAEEITTIKTHDTIVKGELYTFRGKSSKGNEYEITIKFEDDVIQSTWKPLVVVESMNNTESYEIYFKKVEGTTQEVGDVSFVTQTPWTAQTLSDGIYTWVLPNNTGTFSLLQINENWVTSSEDVKNYVLSQLEGFEDVGYQRTEQIALIDEYQVDKCIFESTNAGTVITYSFYYKGKGYAFVSMCKDASVAEKAEIIVRTIKFL